MKIYRISAESRERYIEEAFRNNRLLCLVASLFCIAAEGFNIVRVLFLSNRGLETINNRIYFGFYLFLLVCSVLYLIIGRRKWDNLKTANRICLIYAGIVLMWNTCLNVYDILRSDRAHVIMAATMLVAFSALVIMEPVYELIYIGVNYFIFMTLAEIPLYSGEGFNYTLTAIMAGVICGVRFQHLCIELDQRNQIREIGRKLDERRLWLTKEQYDLISQNAGFITFQWDLKSDRIVFSKNWKEFFECSYVIPKFCSFIDRTSLIQDAQKQKIEKCMEDVQRGIHYQKFEVLLPAKGQNQRWFKVQVVCQQPASEESAMCAVGFINDITAEKERLLDLERNAALDSFTGLLNKASIDDYGRKWLEDLSLKMNKMAMLILDMDDFKKINDTYGHPCGDYVLKQVAEQLVEYAPEGAKVGRLGGDEFLVLMEVQGNEYHIYEYAAKVIQKVKTIQWNGQDVNAKCSIGFAVAAEPGWSYEKLYKCADDALYTAKKSGKNRVREYSAGQTEEESAKR